MSLKIQGHNNVMNNLFMSLTDENTIKMIRPFSQHLWNSFILFTKTKTTRMKKKNKTKQKLKGFKKVESHRWAR